MSWFFPVYSNIPTSYYNVHLKKKRPPHDHTRIPSPTTTFKLLLLFSAFKAKPLKLVVYTSHVLLSSHSLFGPTSAWHLRAPPLWWSAVLGPYPPPSISRPRHRGPLPTDWASCSLAFLHSLLVSLTPLLCLIYWFPSSLPQAQPSSRCTWGSHIISWL
jgi:hypothetical protein